MDQDPSNNRTPTNQDRNWQYQWFSPLRDIQPSIFNPTTTTYPEDNNIHEIDPELFAEGATHTSVEPEKSNNSGYYTQQYWSNPVKDNQSSIPYSNPATSPENCPTTGIDPATCTEEPAGPSTNMDQPRHQGLQRQDTQTTTQAKPWPTTATTNPKQLPTNGSSHTNSYRPIYQRLKTQNAESNTTPSRTEPKPYFNQPTTGQGSGSQTNMITPNMGATPKCTHTNMEHNNPNKNRDPGREIPNIPHNGSHRSREQSDISNSKTTPTVLGNIPPTNPKSDNSRNTPSPNIREGQHADATPRLEKTPNNSGNQQGYNHLPRGTSNPTGNPQMPHQRTHYKNIRQGSHNHGAYDQNNPTTSPRTTLAPTSTATTSRGIQPQQTRGGRSPIRFPTPEPQNVPIPPNQERHSTAIKTGPGNPRRNPIKIHAYNPQDPRVRGRSLQSETVNSDPSPRRSQSHNGNDLFNDIQHDHKRDQHPQTNNCGPSLNKRHHTRTEASKYNARSATNVTPIMANSQQDAHSQFGPSAKRTRHQNINRAPGFSSNPTTLQPKSYVKKHIRHHDEKGVSNFHLDQNDQIVRTHAGHPRCNYCFVASHPRTKCKIRLQDLLDGIDRAIHPEKGLLSYRNAKNTNDVNPPETSIEQLPNEILEKICEYLTFEERCKFGATNRRNQFVLTADKFWHTVSIPNHILKYELINKLINMGTRSLSIPWSSIDGEWAEYSHLVSTLSTFASQLSYLNISGFNNSPQIRGDNRIIAMLIAKSTSLKTLDVTESKLALMSEISIVIPYGHRLTSLNLSMVGCNNHHNFLLRYSTIERIVDKLKSLKNIILAGTSLCRKSITYLCTYLSSTVEKINLATERVRDSDIRALTNTCPNISFLNISETLVTIDVFPELATTWSESMRYLSLPKRIATELNLASDRVRYFQYLEDLTLLWRRDVINPRDTPILAIIAQFKTTVDSMSSLRYLNIGNYANNVEESDSLTKSTLQRLFHHITINLSPYNDQYPVSEDPCSVFQDGWIMNTDIESIPSLSPSSTVSTIPMEDNDS